MKLCFKAAQRLVGLFQEDHGRIQARGRVAGSALRVHGMLKERPVTTLRELSARTGLSFPAAASGMNVLTGLGIAAEVTGKRRDRVFTYERYLSVLSEGTEPL